MSKRTIASQSISPAVKRIIYDFITRVNVKEISRDLLNLLLEYLQQEATRDAMPPADLFGNMKATLKFLNALADYQADVASDGNQK